MIARQSLHRQRSKLKCVAQPFLRCNIQNRAARGSLAVRNIGAQYLGIGLPLSMQARMPR